MPTMIRPASWATADRIAPVLTALYAADDTLDELHLELFPLGGRDDRFTPPDDAPTPSFKDVGVLSVLIEEAADELDSMRRRLDDLRKLHEVAAVFALNGDRRERVSDRG
jgi:hypothetical protein